MATCAPTRRVRHSAALGRETCLSPAEERRVLGADAASGGSSRDNSRSAVSDRTLADRVGLKDIVRPSMPGSWSASPNEWLSNVDIDQVLEQYARLVPGFRYLGTLPTDFAEHARRGGECVEICEPDKFAETFRKGDLAASVVNLDTHTGSGTHWVALMLDCRMAGSPRIYYYDSTGRPPPRRWMTGGAWAVLIAGAPTRRMRRELLRTAKFNRVPHQRGSSECGVFAMMAIDAMIAGRSFRDHCERVMSDDDAFKQRAIFFEAPPGFVHGEGSQGRGRGAYLQDEDKGEEGLVTERWSWSDILTATPSSRRRL